MKSRSTLIAALILLFFSACRAPAPRLTLLPAYTQIVLSSEAVAVTDVHIPCPAIGGMLWYRAIVPKVAAGERLPVLYLLHGGTSNPQAMQQDTDAVKQAIAERIIIVTPDAHNSWYTNAKHKPNERWERPSPATLSATLTHAFPRSPAANTAD